MVRVGDQEFLWKGKKLNQWFFKITQFSNELLESLNNLKDWPNKVKIMQQNWIGKSYGCEIKFKIESKKMLMRLSVILQGQILYLECLF